MTAPHPTSAIVDGGRAYVTITREYLSYVDVAFPHLVPDLPSRRSRTVTDKVERVGTIVVDLAAGTCAFDHAAVGRSGAAHWLEPIALAGRAATTASGLTVAIEGDKVLAIDRDRRVRVIGTDPKHRAAWLPGTDAVVLDRRVVDAVDGEDWRHDGRFAVAGASLFVPTHQLGVIELSGAPHAQRAVHLPPGATDLPWLSYRTWPIGETNHGATLVQTPDGVFLDLENGRVFLGANPGTIRLYDGIPLAAGDGILVDLVEHHTVTRFASPPDVARVAGLVALASGGAYWTTNERLTWIVPFEIPSFLDVVAFDGQSLLFHQPDRKAMLVFDVTSRSWRAIGYERCVPKIAPVPPPPG
ncbi:MAG TPA: hypothetical protein VFT22_14635 [Kofleriaceae bacterium]|nr:hypothetical protein [Kofleriaceae bacterium]